MVLFQDNIFLVLEGFLFIDEIGRFGAASSGHRQLTLATRDVNVNAAYLNEELHPRILRFPTQLQNVRSFQIHQLPPCDGEFGTPGTVLLRSPPKFALSQ